jgi:hypothetical protein
MAHAMHVAQSGADRHGDREADDDVQGLRPVGAEAAAAPRVDQVGQRIPGRVGHQQNACRRRIRRRVQPRQHPGDGKAGAREVIGF